jgi:hypothetical protein
VSRNRSRASSAALSNMAQSSYWSRSTHARC